MIKPRDAQKRIAFQEGYALKALVDGRKTQTRRLITPPVPPKYDVIDVKGDVRTYRRFEGDDPQEVVEKPAPYEADEYVHVRTPHWRAGTRERTDRVWCPYLKTIRYKDPLKPDRRKRTKPQGDAWKAIHMATLMPKWASRILLHIKDVRPERIQDMTDDDIAAEGFYGRHRIAERYLSVPDAMYWLRPYDPERAPVFKAYQPWWDMRHARPNCAPRKRKRGGTTQYEVYPYSRNTEWAGTLTYNDHPVRVIYNPWVWRIAFRVVPHDNVDW